MPRDDLMGKAMSRMQTQYGWSPEVSAGIVGNLWHESVGGNPLAVGDSGASFGLGQWNAERRQALGRFATEQGKPVDDPDVQLDFVNYEMAKDYPQLISALQNVKSPAEAARLFSQVYERPGRPMMDSRIQQANRAFQLAGKIAATVPAEETGLGYTKDDIRAELKKREEVGAKVSEAGYAKDDIKAELKRRGLSLDDIKGPTMEPKARPGLLDVPQESLTPAGRVIQMGERILDAYVPGLPVPAKGAAERFESLERAWQGGWSHFYGDFLGNIVGGFGQRLSEMKAGMPERGRFGVDRTSPADVVAPVVGYVKQIAEKIAPRYQGRGDLQDKIFEGLGSAPAAFAKYALTTAIGGPIAGMALAGAITSANKEPVERFKAVLADTVMGVGFKAVEPLSVMSKSTTLAGMGAMQAKLEGGDANDIAAGAATMFLLGVSAHGGNVSAKEALTDAYKQFSKKYNKLPESEKVELRDWIQEEQFSEKMEGLKRQYEEQRKAEARTEMPEEVKKPTPTPEETTAEVERLKEEYRAGQEHPILTETLDPDALDAIRGRKETPDIDAALRRAVIGERTHPASPAGVKWEADFPPEGTSLPRVGPEPQAGMPDWKGREVETEARDMARQQQFMEQHKDIQKWYEGIKERRGQDAADEMLGLYLAEKGKGEMFGGGPKTGEWFNKIYSRVTGLIRKGKQEPFELRTPINNPHTGENDITRLRLADGEPYYGGVSIRSEFDAWVGTKDNTGVDGFTPLDKHGRWLHEPFDTKEEAEQFIKQGGDREIHRPTYQLEGWNDTDRKWQVIDTYDTPSEALSGFNRWRGDSVAQITSAGRMFGGGPDTSDWLKKIAPIWYSRMKQFLTDPKIGLPERGTGEQFANLAEQWAKKGQFKQDELKWTGLIPWLREQKGKVTREQVGEFLKENQVEVREVEKGGHGLEPAEIKRLQELHDVARDRGLNDSELEEWRDLNSRYKVPETKFQSYMKLPPGGENYREILLGVPQEVLQPEYTRAETERLAAYDKRQKQYAEFMGRLENAGWTNSEAHNVLRFALDPNPDIADAGKHHLKKVASDVEINSLVDLEKEVKEGSKRVMAIGRVPSFEVPSSHAYGDPAADVNRFAHIFVDDRIIDGKKYLTIWEGPQDDWRLARIKESERLAKEEGLKSGTAEFKKRADEIRKEHKGKTIGNVPSYPFEGRSMEVAMKKILRKAAEEGYDGVAWATGDMVKERYDLSKLLDEVVTKQTRDGKYLLTADDYNGNTVIEGKYSAEELPGIIGKEMADKIVNAHSIDPAETTWKGEGLKVGGEWANRQYDGMMPQFLNKYGKQWGARVGEGDISGGAKSGYLIAEPYEGSEGEGWVVVYRGPDAPAGQVMSPPFRTEAQANASIKGGQLPKENIHTLPFTPEMKESVLYKGQSMFSGGPDTTQWFKDITDRVTKSRENKESPVDLTDIKEHSNKLFSRLQTKPEDQRGWTVEDRLASTIKGPQAWTNYMDIIGRYLGAGDDGRSGRQGAALENFRQRNRINQIVPDKARQEAITNWIEAGGDMETLRQRASLTQDPRLKRGYEAAQGLTPEEIGLAHEMVDYFDSMLRQGQEAGIIGDAVDNYINHIWKKDSPTARRLSAENNAGLLNTNFNYARKRIWSTYFEGEQAGKRAKNKEVGYLFGRYHQAFYEALAARRAIKEMSGAVMEDGLPMVTVSGGMPIQKIAEETRPFSEVPGEYDMTSRPTPEKNPYLIRPHKLTEEQFRNYQRIDHPALRQWKWIGNDLDGKPVLLQGDMLVHKDIYPHLKNVLGKSAIRKTGIGRGIMAGQQSLKNTLLAAGGLFHQVHVGSHAVFHLVNPFNPAPIDLINNPAQRALVNHGAMVFDHRGMADFSEGLHGTGLVNKIPVLGPILDRYGHYLFQDYIPRLKMAMGEAALQRNIERYSGKYNMDQILELTANQANGAFGELNYKFMGRNPTTQDVFRLIGLAPDFLEARARFVGQSFKPGGKEQAYALLRAAIGLYLVPAMFNSMFSNDKRPHWNKPFTFIIGDKEYKLRSVPGDVYHLINDPRSFVHWRLNPTVTRTVVEGITGRDMFGRKRSTPQQARDFFVAHAPIPVQTFFQGKEVSIVDSALGMLGVQAGKYRSDADRVMQDYFADYRIDRPTTSQTEEMSRVRKQVMNDMRQGRKQSAMNRVKSYAQQQKITSDKALQWIEESSLPEGVANFKRLPIDWMAKALQKATPEEEKQFLPIFLDKYDKASTEKLIEAKPEIQKYMSKRKGRRGFSIVP